MTGVNQLPIHFSRECRLRQSCTDTGRDLGDSDRAFKLANGFVGQCDFKHDELLKPRNEKARINRAFEKSLDETKPRGQRENLPDVVSGVITILFSAGIAAPSSC
jgi:hypothetical protein